MKKYVVMVNYGVYEGWKIQDEMDDFQAAVRLRDTCAGYSQEVVIFKPVELIVTEKMDSEAKEKS